MDALLRDLVFALRRLRRQPLSPMLAVLTLALGIGATTAIFSVANAVLLRGLPYLEPGRLGMIWVDFGEEGQSLPAISPLDFRDLEAMSQRFEGLAGGTGVSVNLVGEGEPEQVQLGRVTYDLFPLLGVEPALGRGFAAEEEVVGGPPVVVLGHALWQRRFAGDPKVIGKTVSLDGSPMEVVGVMPADFRLILPAEAWWLGSPDVWAPLQDPYTGNRNRTTLNVVGRLKPGASFAQAQEELVSIAAQLRAEHAVHAQSDTRIRVVPLEQDVVKGVRPSLIVLAGAGALVLLIACGNVANLMLAQAARRRGELALCAALGAGRSRLFRQALGEAALVGAAAGLVGLTLAAWGITLLLHLEPAHLPRLDEVRLDPATVAFAVGCALVAALLVGLAPALGAARLPGEGLRPDGSRGVVGTRQSRLRRLVIVGELAISLALLIASGLLVRSFLSLRDVRPGFDADHVLSLRLSLPRGRYPDAATRTAFHDRLTERLRTLPGVVAVGGTSQLPLTGGGNQLPYAFDEETARKWESVTADSRSVTQELFATMGTRLLAGRIFDEHDSPAGQRVVIVDETLAAKAFPGRDAVGERLQLPVFLPEGVTRQWLEIVGVVEHVRMHDVARDGREQVYLPHRQVSRAQMDVVLRVAGDPAALAGTVTRAVREIDAQLPIESLRPLADVVTAARAQARFTLVLIGAFAAIALALALVGLYAVVHSAVGERTRELCVRRALGATAGNILGLVVRYGLSLAALGIAIGIAVALLAGRALAALLHGVSATDPLTFLAAPLALLAVALAASLVPAVRAVRVDPMTVLRGE